MPETTTASPFIDALLEHERARQEQEEISQREYMFHRRESDIERGRKELLTLFAAVGGTGTPGVNYTPGPYGDLAREANVRAEEDIHSATPIVFEVEGLAIEYLKSDGRFRLLARCGNCGQGEGIQGRHIYSLSDLASAIQAPPPKECEECFEDVDLAERQAVAVRNAAKSTEEQLADLIIRLVDERRGGGEL